jgi:hypothetical protein
VSGPPFAARRQARQGRECRAKNEADGGRAPVANHAPQPIRCADGLISSGCASWRERTSVRGGGLIGCARQKSLCADAGCIVIWDALGSLSAPGDGNEIWLGEGGCRGAVKNGVMIPGRVEVLLSCLFGVRGFVGGVWDDWRIMTGEE